MTLREALAGPAAGVLDRAAAAIAELADHYSGVYLYVLEGDTLVLGGYHGRPSPHTRIPVGYGICGYAVASDSDIEVADVTTDGRYLAPNTETRSELLVLVRDGSDIVGQIDIDSDELDPFTTEDHLRLHEVAELLVPTVVHTMRPSTS